MEIVQMSTYWYVIVLQGIVSWVEKVEFYSDRVLFEVVGAVVSLMHVLQLRINVI
jgi:hypothetical protein